MGIRKDKVYKYWIYQFQYLGKNYGERGFKTRREAESARASRRDEVKKEADELGKKKKTDTGFKELALDYLDFAEKKFVRDVYLRKANVYRLFRATLPGGDLPITQITPQHISQYLLPLPNSQYNEHRHELSTLFNWVKRIHGSQFPTFFNPCLNVEAMTYVEKEKIPPTMEEVQRMIAAAKPGDEKDLLLVCLQTLGRIDEVLRLRWPEDVNFEKRYVVLWTRKRKDGKLEPDALPMNDDLYSVLKNRWKQRKQDKWVFWNQKSDEGKGNRFMARPRMMAAICKRAGITPIGKGSRIAERGPNKGKRVEVDLYYGFHHLRHFMATYLLDEEKVSLKTTSSLLRHKNIRTTERYTHKIEISSLAAADAITGKFTSKNANPIQEADTNEKGVTSSNP